MALLGLALLGLVGLGLVTTGLPAVIVILGVSVFGAAVAALSGGGSTGVLAALPNRLVNLLENDLLQALPLFVLMGALMDRLPVVPALFRSVVALRPNSRAAPAVASLGLGALLGPMNGSVGASVMALGRGVVPQLEARGYKPAEVAGLTAVASTLGVVVPPSLVLILLGDAMMSAHTIALNATGHSARVVNTQDVYRGALIPAGLFLLLAMGVAWARAGRTMSVPGEQSVRPSGGDLLLAGSTLVFVAGLLVGVAAGLFYAVEAAALGAVVLFVAALVTGRLGGGRLQALLEEVIAGTGALMALLVAATSLTLLLRVLGTDRLVADLVRAIPGGPLSATVAVLAVVGASATVLDAFEIIFVVVPVVAPPLLEQAEDPVWVSTLFLMILQASYLMPPFGYALLLVQGTLRHPPAPRQVWRAVLPYLAAQVLVLATVLLRPGLVHVLDPPQAATAPALNDQQIDERMKDLALPPDEAPPLGGLGPPPAGQASPAP